MIKSKAPCVKYNGFQGIHFDLTIWSPHKDIQFGNRVQIGTEAIYYAIMSNFKACYLTGVDHSWIN